MAGAKVNKVKPIVCNTVGELIAHLGKYPSKTKLHQDTFSGGGVVPVLYNEGYESEHMVFEENDGAYT